jgi:NAD(P)-dependent dehydrogenase (short-subunit alcohol dehydrogenase family)
VSGGQLRFDGRVAVVTGAGRGLGRQHALLLAARGARVVVNDAGGMLSGGGSDTTAAESVAREIAVLGGEAVADANSIATPEGAAAVIAGALKRFGRVDIVVNNAGIVRDEEFAKMTPEDLDAVLDVHLHGTFHVTRAAWTDMVKRGYGRVVNTCSAAGLLGVQNMSNYGAAKGGVFGLTRTLAVEGAPLGVHVNAVAPIAWTRMLENAIAAAMPQDAQSKQLLEELSKTFLTTFKPELVSPIVAYLAHESCSVSGEVYSAGGGQVSQLFMGRTQGYHHPMLTMELVHEHFARIRDQSTFTTPGNSGEEMALVFAALAASTSS